MIDIGLKAPTIDVMYSNLVSVGAMVYNKDEDTYTTSNGVGFDFIGYITKTPAVVENDVEVSPAVLTADVHANLRLYGEDAEEILAKIKNRTKIALKDDPQDGAPVAEGREDGFKWFMLDQLATPSRVWA